MNSLHDLIGPVPTYFVTQNSLDIFSCRNSHQNQNANLLFPHKALSDSPQRSFFEIRIQFCGTSHSILRVISQRQVALTDLSLHQEHFPNVSGSLLLFRNVQALVENCFVFKHKNLSVLSFLLDNKDKSSDLFFSQSQRLCSVLRFERFDIVVRKSDTYSVSLFFKHERGSVSLREMR